MNPEVYFTPVADAEAPEVVGDKTVELADRAGLDGIVRENALVGILQHVGEGDGVGYVKPPVTRAVAERIRELGGSPFLTGSATLYKGRRSDAPAHMQQAYDHGFTPDAIACPIVMCDGLRGGDRVSVEVPDAAHCRTAYLGSAVGMMDALIAISHPTGHIGAGFGATIKNISMGLASRGGKLAMHHGSYPVFLEDACTACGQCVKWCPEDAIVIRGKARLIKKKCVGCGECFSVCPHDAIDFQWNVNGIEFQEKMVEYCMAAKSLLGDRIVYVNVLQHFQKDCDCMGHAQEAMCPDVGVAASRDPVAIDAATADLFVKATGKDMVLEAGGRDYRGMLAYGETMGLGSCDYELVEL
jgi:uncharacterized Fe-S center protein